MNQNKIEPRVGSRKSPQLETPITFQPITEGLGFHPFSDGLPYAPISKSVQKLSLKPTLNSKNSPVQPSLQPAPQNLAQIESNILVGRYYFLKRVLAYFFDSLLIGILTLLGLATLVIEDDLKLDFFFDTSLLGLTFLFVLMVNWSIISLEEICFGNSLGKKLFGLKLGGKKRFRILRAFLFVPSFGFLGFGLWMSFFDSKKRCWHDKLAHLQPVEVAHL
jgi:uncharacterized RDD family membrane protein YckC